MENEKAAQDPHCPQCQGRFYRDPSPRLCSNCHIVKHCSKICQIRYDSKHILKCNASTTGNCIPECVLHSIVTNQDWLSKIPDLADPHLCRIDQNWGHIIEFLISRVRRAGDVESIFTFLVQKGLNRHKRHYVFNCAQKQQSTHWMRLLMQHGQFSPKFDRPLDWRLTKIIQTMPVECLKSAPQSERENVLVNLPCQGICSIFHRLLTSNLRKYDRLDHEFQDHCKAAVKFYHALYERCGLDMYEIDPFSFYSSQCNPAVCKTPIDSLGERSSLLPLASCYYALKQAQTYLVGLVATSLKPLQLSFPNVLVNLIHAYVYSKEQELTRQRIVSQKPRDCLLNEYLLKEWSEMLTFIDSVINIEPAKKRLRLC